MTGVSASRQGENSRPEDAATAQEFQARRDAELARMGAATSYGWDYFRGALAVIVATIDGFYWYRFAHAPGLKRWHELLVALAFLAAVGNGTHGLVRDIRRRQQRRREVERLGRQWQARANQEEAP